MKFKTLDALFKMFSCGKELQDMEWRNIFDIWNGMKHQKVIELDVNSYWCLKISSCFVGLFYYDDFLTIDCDLIS